MKAESDSSYRLMVYPKVKISEPTFGTPKKILHFQLLFLPLRNACGQYIVPCYYFIKFRYVSRSDSIDIRDKLSLTVFRAVYAVIHTELQAEQTTAPPVFYQGVWINEVVGSVAHRKPVSE